jgi:hypothetical protein
MVNAEDARGEVILKFQAACKHHRVNTTDVDDLTVFGAEDAGALAFTTTNLKGQPQLNETAFKALDDLIVRAGAKLVVLDPLAAFIPAGVNDPGVMPSMMKGLKRVAQERDCAVLLIAHTRKGGDADKEGAEITAGSAAITNLARGVLTVRMPTAKVLEEIGAPFGSEASVRELVDLKANLKPLGEHSFFQLASVKMDNGTSEYPEPDFVAVAEPFTPTLGGRSLPLTALRAAAERLAHGHLNAGTYQPFSTKHQAGSRYYPEQVGRTLSAEFPTASPRELTARAKAAVEELTARGWIEVGTVPIPGTRSNREGVTVKWSATPWAADPQPGPFTS